MKIKQVVICGLLAIIAVCQAQGGDVPPPGRTAAASRFIPQFDPSAMRMSQASSFSPLNNPSQPVVAEAITPEIQALARGLENDPLRIFNYVHDHIRHVYYFGSKKGAQLTLLEKSGNDFDQCALTVALLRAANYTNAAYQFGWMLLPFSSPDHKDLCHWLTLSQTNGSWLTTSNYLYDLTSQRGYPAYCTVAGATNSWGIQRVWVTLPIGATTYYLDPAFKVSETITGINLTTAMNFSSNGIVSAAAGLETGNYVTNLSEVNLRGTLAGYTTNLLNYVQSNYPNATVEQILGGFYIVPSTNTTLSTTTTFPTSGFGGPAPLDWDNEPTNLMSTLTITFANTNFSWFMPSLQGQRVALTYSNSGIAQLWQDDVLLRQAQAGLTGGTNDVVLTINHPVGIWDFGPNAFVDATNVDAAANFVCQSTNATYAWIYSFEPDWAWLRERQDQLDAYRQQGLSDTSRQVVSESLNVMGLSWVIQNFRVEQILGIQMGILPQYSHQMGRMAQENGNGYYVDVGMALTGAMPDGGANHGDQDRWFRFFDLTSFFGSALEHGIIEQLQNSNLVAASTVKMLQIANTNGQAIYLGSSTNWTTVRSKLVNYSTATLNSFDDLVASGYYLLLPRNGSNHVASGTGTWAGWGVLQRAANINGFLSTSMLISGDYHGGYVSFYGVQVPASWLANTHQAAPQWAAGSPFAVPFPRIGDPVDTASGTFETENTDLSIGQATPRGITLSRYYNGRRRNGNPAGMAYGWVHNYNINATETPAPQTGLGGTTPAQMAPMLVASCVAAGIYNDVQPSPKNWVVTALIAKWGIDQLTRNAVSVTLGKETLQFVKQPDGSFTPPAGSTWTLTKPNAYVLQERHGNTFKFNSSGRLTNIVDQYSQPMNLTYNASNWVQTVTDWKGRAFTFNYTGSHLTSVSDNQGRSISYGYSGQGDLNSFTDAEGKTSTFVYDTNHQITATLDALNRLVVTNIYDAFGHITTQFTQGDTNKTWQIFWSGWQTVAQDPAGSKQRYFFDDKTRIVGEQDALGSLTQMFYDGQDHRVMTVSPLNETNQSVFDGNHNLLYTIDPLGFSNQFFYDSKFNLMRSVDARDNPSTFGYNSQFSLTGSTNGAGDWTTYTYNTDGTLATKVDPGGSTGYDYDTTYRQLNLITYPGSLGSESFVTSPLGDVTNHTDGRGFATSFLYNNRRQLTNTIAPTNLTTKVAFDANGSVFSTTDARGFSTTNIWSVTAHLLATVFPQGSIITNVYDSRDWLSKTVDPLQHATLFTNDAAQRLVSVTDPLQRTSKFGFDANGHQFAATNAADEVTRQTWDKRGQLLQLTDGANHTSLRGYDFAGNQIILTNRNGKLWQFQFDAANRLTNTITPMNRQTTLTFDNRGLLKTLREPSLQSTTNNFDAKGRLTNRLDSLASTTFNFDANNNVTNIVENGKTNTWTFDAYNRRQTYKDADGNLIQYRFDNNGNVTNLIYPGNRTVTYFYDSLNRLTNVTDWASRKTTITYDLASQVKSITRPNGTVRTIDYDSAGQTTNIVERTAGNLPICIFRLNWSPNATVQWEFVAPLPHNATVPTRTMTYDDDNRLDTFNGTSVTSDADGNLTSAPLTNSTFTSYIYDVRNRLTSAGGLSYAYDPVGNRTAITNGATVTKFVINPNAKLSQALMRVKNGVTNYYIYGLGLLYEITETVSSTNTLTYHFDYRGSTVAMTDANGNVTDRIEYSAYGLTTCRAGTNDTPFLFNGRFGVQTDANGLLHMRARFYNPYLCRFLNADPSGFSGGLNFYAYADGNPVSLLDPFGLDGNSVSGLGGTWPSSPYAPGGAYYVTPTPSPLFSSASPFSFGVTASANAEGGYGFGAGANGFAGGGLFSNNQGINAGGFYGGGTFIGGPNVGIFGSANVPSGGDQPSGAFGAAGGFGSGFWFSNAGSSSNLGGPFSQWNFNGPGVSVSYASSDGTWITSVTFGGKLASGFSFSSYPTTTPSAGGFNLNTGRPFFYNPKH